MCGWYRAYARDNIEFAVVESCNNGFGKGISAIGMSDMSEPVKVRPVDSPWFVVSWIPQFQLPAVLVYGCHFLAAPHPPFNCHFPTTSHPHSMVISQLYHSPKFFPHLFKIFCTNSSLRCYQPSQHIFFSKPCSLIFVLACKNGSNFHLR